MESSPYKTNDNINEEDDDEEFNPSANMLIHHDLDDERTLDEEENSLFINPDDESLDNEVSMLMEEGNIPLQELLRKYEHPLDNYAKKNEEMYETDSDNSFNSLSSSSEDAEGAEDGGGGEGGVEGDVDGDVEDNERKKGLARKKRNYLESEGGSLDDFSDDSSTVAYWRKSTRIGDEYQAVVREQLDFYIDEDILKHTDLLLWSPYLYNNGQVNKLMKNLAQIDGIFNQDNEQVLFEFMNQNGNVNETYNLVVNQIKKSSCNPLNTKLQWNKDDCTQFEQGLKNAGKCFWLIRSNFLSHKTTGEIVQFYYFWKKTERYDAFILSHVSSNNSQSAFSTSTSIRRRCSVPTVVVDLMKQFIDETNMPFLDGVLSFQKQQDASNNSKDNDDKSSLLSI